MPGNAKKLHHARAATGAVLALALAVPLTTIPQAAAEPPAHAQGGGKGNPGGGHPGRGNSGQDSASTPTLDLSDPASAAAALGTAVLGKALFTAQERQTILGYFEPYRGGAKGLPPGLAKRDSLPPGLAKRGGSLPPGLRGQALPGDLASRLPARDDRWRRVVVGSDVVLIDAVSDIVVDVIRGVL